MSMFFPPDSPTSEQAVEPQQRRRGRRWALRGLAVIVALIAVVIAAGGIYVGSVSRSFTSNVQREPLMPGTTAPTKPDATAKPAPSRPAAGKTEALNYVLMGSDSRDLDNSGAGRSDVLMVLHLAADRKDAYVISFPRDLYVPIPGYGRNKINAAFAFGGPPLTVQTLEQMLDVRMDHVALIDFEGFIALTEQLGGVTVDNKHASSSRGYDFPAGKITISGDEALAFVRERYTLPRGDLDRAERQRQVVQAILAKGMSRETLANPARFNSFVAGVSRHLTIDDQLSDAEIRKTALSLRLTASDVHLLQSPITGFDTVDGMSIDVVDERRTKELARALRDDTMDKYLKNYPAR